MNVQCQICNKKMDYARITRHVKTTHKHDISWDTYLVKFIDSLPMHNFCIVCNENVVYKYQTCSPSCKSIILSQKSKKYHEDNPGVWEGRVVTDETRKKLSESRKGMAPWNKGLTKETDDRIIKQTVNSTKNRKPRKNYRHSKETRKKISDATLGRTPWNVGITHSSETIKKIVTHRKNNKLENEVASILSKNKIDFTHQYFLNRGGENKSFDFYIKSKNLLLEIDGDYWHGGPGCEKHFYKVNEVRENDTIKNKMAIHNGFNILRIWESEIKNNPSVIMDKLQKI